MNSLLNAVRFCSTFNFWASMERRKLEGPRLSSGFGGPPDAFSIYSGHDFVNFHTILFILDTFHYMLLHLSKRDLIIPRLFDFVNQMTCLFHFFMRFGHHLGPCTIYLGSQKSTLELSWRWDYFTLVCIALSHTWGKLSYWG